MSLKLEYNQDCSTRGNKYKLVNQTFHSDLRKYFFSLRASLIFGIAYQTMLVMLTLLTSLKRACHTIRYDARCYFNVRSKADMSHLNLYTARNRQLKSGKQKN